MIHIRPISDLRNKCPEIEDRVLASGEPVEVEVKLEEADKAAAASDVRYTSEEVFGRVRRHHERKAL